MFVWSACSLLDNKSAGDEELQVCVPSSSPAAAAAGEGLIWFLFMQQRLFRVLARTTLSLTSQLLCTTSFFLVVVFVCVYALSLDCINAFFFFTHSLVGILIIALGVSGRLIAVISKGFSLGSHNIRRRRRPHKDGSFKIIHFLSFFPSLDRILRLHRYP